MRLGYFAMPLHPHERDWCETLNEDREAVILADKLGFYDAFIGEHLTDYAESITNSMLFLATLIHSTKSIKLATGTSNLSQTHPTLVACHAAMFDHLAKGRFILGVSPGNLRTDAEVLGQLEADKNALFAESIDVILEIWNREPPYNIDLPGNRFKVSTARSAALELGLGIMRKPYQSPRPEIVGTVVAPYSKGVILMGKRDFHPLSANFLMPKWAKTHWANYAEGKTAVGKTASICDWRLARTVFVADDDTTAQSYGGADEKSPYRFYYRQLLGKFARLGRFGVFKNDEKQPDSDITTDYVVDNLVIRGTVNKVVDEILALRDVTGDFGELVYAGMDWVDPKLAKRSMELMATEVLPRVNAAIAKSSSDSAKAAEVA